MWTGILSFIVNPPLFDGWTRPVCSFKSDSLYSSLVHNIKPSLIKIYSLYLTHLLVQSVKYKKAFFMSADWGICNMISPATADLCLDYVYFNL